MNSFRGGYQVHSVPDDERVFDSHGQRLPWGYSYADSSLNRKQPVEKGPFGKATNRRARSRSKTATPTAKEDQRKLEDQKVIDEVFSKFKKDLEESAPIQTQQRPSQPQPAVNPVTTFPRQQQLESGPQQQQQTALSGGSAALPTATRTFKDPSEVIIYGFGSEYEYAAIDYFEQASGGRIYEDYDRQPQNARYNTALSTAASRASIPRSLSQAVIRKINTYQGGNHWIKVTFDSPEAAQAAFYASPHIIHGWSCYCEPWTGVPPKEDAAIPATEERSTSLRYRKPTRQQGGRDWVSLPGRIHNDLSQPVPQDNSFNSSTSSTATSATATGTDAQPQSIPPQSPLAPSRSENATQGFGSVQNVDHAAKPLRIPTAKRAILLPASSALLPTAPWKQRAFGHLPLVGSLFGGPVGGQQPAPGEGESGMIGSTIPRKEDGTFDWDKASYWWRLCAWVDWAVGTDLCGIKGDE